MEKGKGKGQGRGVLRVKGHPPRVRLGNGGSTSAARLNYRAFIPTLSDGSEEGGGVEQFTLQPPSLPAGADSSSAKTTNKLRVHWNPGGEDVASSHAASKAKKQAFQWSRDTDDASALPSVAKKQPFQWSRDSDEAEALPAGPISLPAGPVSSQWSRDSDLLIPPPPILAPTNQCSTDGATGAVPGLSSLLGGDRGTTLPAPPLPAPLALPLPPVSASAACASALDNTPSPPLVSASATLASTLASTQYSRNRDQLEFLSDAPPPSTPPSDGERLEASETAQRRDIQPSSFSLPPVVASTSGSTVDLNSPADTAHVALQPTISIDFTGGSEFPSRPEREIPHVSQHNVTHELRYSPPRGPMQQQHTPQVSSAMTVRQQAEFMQIVSRDGVMETSAQGSFLPRVPQPEIPELAQEDIGQRPLEVLPFREPWPSGDVENDWLRHDPDHMDVIGDTDVIITTNEINWPADDSWQADAAIETGIRLHSNEARRVSLFRTLGLDHSRGESTTEQTVDHLSIANREEDDEVDLKVPALPIDVCEGIGQDEDIADDPHTATQQILGNGSVAKPSGKVPSEQLRCVRISAPIRSSCVFAVAIVIVLGTGIVLYSLMGPVPAMGAFGLPTQVSREQSIIAAYFAQAQSKAIGWTGASSGRIRQTEANQPVSSSVATNVSVDSLNENSDSDVAKSVDLQWRYVEMFYSKRNGHLSLDAVDLDHARSIEHSITNLPGWIDLCHNHVPDRERHLCDPGVSFIAVVFGAEGETSIEASSMGVLTEVTFDGKGKTMAMPLKSYIHYLRGNSAKILDWWFPRGDGSSTMRALRSIFAFHLAPDLEGKWDNFVKGELEPFLGKLVESIESTDANKLNLFFRMSEVDDELVGSWGEFSFWVAPFAVLCAVTVVTRRIFLSVAAVFLSFSVPIISCVLINTFIQVLRTHDEQARDDTAKGRWQYPVVAFAAWFAVAASCSELAIASTCCWSRRGGSKSSVPKAKRRSEMKLFVEVLTPQLVAPASLFTAASLVPELPLVSEYMRHVAVGQFLVMFLGVVLFLPAIDLGDTVAAWCEAKGVKYRWWLPHEFGTSFPSYRLSVCVEHFVKILPTVGCRLLVFTVVIFSLILACSFWEDAQVDVTTPPLFPAGHRVHDGPLVKQLFDGLPASTGSFKALPRNARICKPDAFDDARCSFTRCEVKDDADPKREECDCYSQQYPTFNPRTCNASARFWGLDALDGRQVSFLQKPFWDWASGQLGLQLEARNETQLITYPVQGPYIEMTEWSTGTKTIESQLASSVKDNVNATGVVWEGACVRIQCFCGKICKMQDGWSNLGIINYETGAQQRRLMPSETASSPAALDAFLIIVVWGLQRKVDLTSSSLTDLAFSNIAVEDPWIQRHIYSMCAGTAPNLGIVRTTCWIIDFRNWLLARDERFPVRSQDFYSKFGHFMSYTASNATTQGGNKCFWMSNEARIRGTYVSFEISDAERVDVVNLSARWMKYVTLRNKRASQHGGEAWMVSPLLAELETEAALRMGPVIVLCTIVTFSSLTALVLTFSFGTACAIALSTTSTCGCLFLFLLASRGKVGVLQIIAMSTCASSIASPLLRVGQQYAWAMGPLPGHTFLKTLFSPNVDTTDDVATNALLRDSTGSAASQPRGARSFSLDSASSGGFGGRWTLSSGTDYPRAPKRQVKPFIGGSMSEDPPCHSSEGPISGAGIGVLPPRIADLPSHITTIGAHAQDELQRFRRSAREERRYRIIVALRKSSGVIIGVMLAASCSGLALFSSKATLRDIGVGILFSAMAVLCVAVGIFPGLLLAGFGPSELWFYTLMKRRRRGSCSRQEAGGCVDVEDLKPVERLATHIVDEFNWRPPVDEDQRAGLPWVSSPN